MKNKHLFVSALLLAMPLSLMAEDRVIKGYVVDAATGEPVPGAIVSVVGATASVLTQESGDYMLTVTGDDASPSTGTLVVSAR